MSNPGVLRLNLALRDFPLQGPAWPEGTRPVPFDLARHAKDAHALLERAYAQGGGAVEPFDRWWADLQSDSEYDPALCFVVAATDNSMIAFAQCWTSGWIKDIAVDKPHRRRGIARALLSHIFSVFRHRGTAAMGLKVHRDNAGAIQLYQSLGMSVDRPAVPR